MTDERPPRGPGMVPLPSEPLEPLDITALAGGLSPAQDLLAGSDRVSLSEVKVRFVDIGRGQVGLLVSTENGGQTVGQMATLAGVLMLEDKQREDLNRLMERTIEGVVRQLKELPS